MSRIVVKNLPKNITDTKLREHFSVAGNVTDVQLKYTKEGRFRQFAFVGYQTEAQGLAAVQQFNRTCINTSRIVVEQCEALGSAKKPKSWSKYSADSTAYQKLNKIDATADDGKIKNVEKVEKSKKKKSKVEEIFEAHKNDPKFIEFIDAHGKGAKGIWKNDLGLAEEIEDNESSNVVDNELEEKLEKPSIVETNDDTSKEEKVCDQEISDAEYLKRIRDKAKTKSGDKKIKPESKIVDLLTIKLRNIPFKTKRQDVLTFFKPTKPYSVRLPTKVHGICYVGFKNELDFKKAMLKNRSFWKGKQILFTDFTEKNKESKAPVKVDEKRNSKWSKQEDALKNEEDISESGRIFFRNLPYSATEDELKEMFEKYGPLTEINVPIDPVTRIIKGFGTVTFVMPEHAVRAFNELDGFIFHGRLLHLIPGKNKDDDTEANENDPALNYKQKKALKEKKAAGSTHNWNTLFLGQNAVAELLAEQYSTTKEQILDTTGRGTSAAVRLALGETEIILKMKQFLEDNDVNLDAFEHINGKRSNTIIIAKNLPAGTTLQEIQPMFAKFGLLGRVVLPPSGVTAIIEFLAPTEARSAFKKLAYSRFKNLPLYLEWAPDNTFIIPSNDVKIKSPEVIETNDKETTNNNAQRPASTKAIEKNIEMPTIETKNKEITQNECEDDTPPEPETTLFLRNLNFATRVPAIREHFHSVGPIHMIQVALKKNPEDPQHPISLGYGFIQFKRKSTCDHVLNTMQFTTIEGNRVELKRSDRILQSQQQQQVKTTKKSVKIGEQTGTKILVRNIAFQAKQSEVEEIFQAFGQLKTVRLPKKLSSLGSETHRGFGFVDFYTKTDAKKAFDAVCQSTHLYGKRLVLEWANVDATDVDELRKRTAEHFNATTASKRSKKSVFDVSSVAQLKDDDDE